MVPYRRTISIVGSFRQHYQDVLTAWLKFCEAGWAVTSPLGSPIIKEGIPFVRFETDEPRWDDPTVQTAALHRILRACVTYVVAPGGYVGRTTCYELGRIIQAGQPVYFSDQPVDLPLAVPLAHVLTPTQLVSHFMTDHPAPLFSGSPGTYAEWERQLTAGNYLDL
jgi:hypothetical protein